MLLGNEKHDWVILVIVRHSRSIFFAPNAINQCFCGDEGGGVASECSDAVVTPLLPVIVKRQGAFDKPADEKRNEDKYQSAQVHHQGWQKSKRSPDGFTASKPLQQSGVATCARGRGDGGLVRIGTGASGREEEGGHVRTRIHHQIHVHLPSTMRSGFGVNGLGVKGSG